MAKENETIAEIIAEMRKYATDYYGRTIENGGEKGNPGMFYLDMAQFAKVNADRLEAAEKRMKWTHKKELETRDAVIQTEVAGREAEREAHKREIYKLMKTNAELAKLIDPEKMPPVNAAKLREACIYALAELEHFRKCHDALLHFGDIVHVGNAKHALKTALAAPARNCDKYAITEAKKAFEVAYKDKVGFINFYTDTFAWLYADADESEAGK